MNENSKRFLIKILFACMLFGLCFCKRTNVKVRFVLFDYDHFGNNDTIWISDEVSKVINELVSKKQSHNEKFARKYQLTIFKNDKYEQYYGSGRFLRDGRDTYILPDGKELKSFESLLDSISK